LHSATTLPVAHYTEVIGSHHKATDVLTGRTFDLSRDITLAPRESLILEF